MSKPIIRRVEFLPELPQLSDEHHHQQRVAVYARVSTDHEEQQSSLAAQKDYYSKMIETHDDWTLADIYADDGVTGTSYLRREEFRRMIADCEEGKIDRIVTKSVSRFARNTVDALNSIRKLKALGIGVYFEKEAIWTLDSKGEFLITLMTSLAQEESRSISENVSWGQRKRFADGRYSVAYSHVLGFDYNFVINQEQALLVRRIFRMFLQGYTPHAIARILSTEGIKSPGEKDQWNALTIRRMLSNEKYMGDALLQKEFTIDFLGHRTKKNEGELPQYYVENGHETIIDRELFHYVQEELKRRIDVPYKYSGCTIYSSKFVCGKCGATYYPKPEHSNDKYRKVIWMCRQRFTKGIQCKNTRIDDRKIAEVYSLIADTIVKRSSVITELCLSVVEGCGCPELSSSIMSRKDFFEGGIEDLAIVIQQIEIFPDGKLKAKLIDGDVVYAVFKSK